MENYDVQGLWIFMSQWNCLRPELWILDSALRQWGSEDTNITNFSKIFFAIVFKIFVFLLFFWVYRFLLANDTSKIWQMVYLTELQWHKIFLNLSQKSGNFKILQYFAIFLNINFLFTNKARKLNIAALNQAKASLTKPWLATNEDNCSLVFWERFIWR